MWPRLKGEQGERGASLLEMLIFMAIFTLIVLGIYNAHINFQTAMARSEARAELQDHARRAMEQMLQDLRMAGYGAPTADDPAPLSPITAASSNSVTFLTNEGGATTNLSADANVGDTTLSVASTAGFQVNDAIYVTDEAKYRAATVTAVGGNSLTITPAIPPPVVVGAAGGFSGPTTTPPKPGATVTHQPRQVTYSYAGGTLSRDLGDGAGPQPVITGVSSLTFSYFDANNGPPGTLADIRRVGVQMTISDAPPGQEPVTFTVRSHVRMRNW